jgi:hypothetical protein
MVVGLEAPGTAVALDLPDAPENAQIEGFLELWLMPLITGVIGLSLSVAAILIWVFGDALFGKNR